MKHAALMLALLGALGCASVGHERLGAAPPPADEDTRDPNVVLIVVEGLRADVLDRWLARLRTADFRPSTPSGLGLLAREGFRFSVASRAEAPAPALPLVGAVTLVTGRFPGAHGVPGHRFLLTEDALPTLVDLEAPIDAARLWYGLGGEVAEPADALLAALTERPSLAASLPTGRRAISVFGPLGRGSEWRVPDRAGLATGALVARTTRARSTPLLDRGARDAAVDVLLREGPPPDLLSVWFRGVAAASCHVPDAACRHAREALGVRQLEALREVDALLHRVVEKLSLAHPRAFGDTVFVLVGTGGVVARPEPDAARLTPDELRARLAEGATPACATALRSDALRIVPDEAVARIYLPGSAEARACVATALEAAVERDPEWLAAVVHPVAEPMAGPRAVTAQVGISDGFARTLSAGRLARLEPKLRLALHPRRSGDALVFARAPWMFVPPGAPPAVVVRGGLETAATRVPLLVAGRRLAETVDASLRTLPIELADVAPTLRALLGLPEDALPRPAFLSWSDEGQRPRVELHGAPRQLALPVPPDAPRLQVRREADAVTLILAESAELWAPDKTWLRLGPAAWSWVPNRFERDDAPCTYEEDEERRRWRCSFPLPEGPVVAAARRSPVPDGDGPLDLRAQAPVWGAEPAAPQLAERPALKCATDDHVRLAVAGAAPVGLGSATLALVGDPRNAAPGRLRARVELGQTRFTGTCEQDPLAEACAIAPADEKLDAELSFPLGADLDAAWAAARALDPPTPARRAALATRYGVPPETEAVLTLWLCDAIGRCAERLVGTLDEWRAARARGCP